MRDVLYAVSITLGVLALFFFVGGVAINVIDERSCEAYGEITGHETRHVWWVGCYGNHPKHGWLSKSEWNKTNIATRHRLEVEAITAEGE